MSLSYNVVFLRESGNFHEKMVRVLRACIDAKIHSLPKEAEDYFNAKGRTIERINAENALLIEDTDGYVKEGQGNCQNYCDVNIKNLPKNVSIIRF